MRRGHDDDLRVGATIETGKEQNTSLSHRIRLLILPVVRVPVRERRSPLPATFFRLLLPLRFPTLFLTPIADMAKMAEHS